MQLSRNFNMFINIMDPFFYNIAIMCFKQESTIASVYLYPIKVLYCNELT
jgi:hypothetical protein